MAMENTEGESIPRFARYIKKIHLHARDIRIRRPNGKELFITAELPNHMKSSWSQLGLDSKNYKDPF